MTRQRMFLDISCVEAARQRIRHVYDTFDTVCVQFSGGKDSSAVLYLAKEIHEERGLGPVKVIFRDEEMVSPVLLDYVMKVRDYDWVDMEWYCVDGDTEVITRRGTFPIRDLAGGEHELMTDKGAWVTAPIRHFGHRDVQKVTLMRNGVTKTIRATPDHRWFVQNRWTEFGKQKEEKVERLTQDLKPGDHLVGAWKFRHVKLPSPFGIAHGFVFGDGNKSSNGCQVTFHGDKDTAMKQYFDGHITSTSAGARKDGIQQPRAIGLPFFFKDYPSLDESPSYLYGWLAGYFAADGCVSKEGKVTIASSKKKNLEFFRTVCTNLGIFTHGINKAAVGTYGNAESESWQMTIAREDLTSEFFIIPHHKDRWLSSAKSTNRRKRLWKVVSVEDDGSDEVYCAVVDKTHSFVLADHILTGNCLPTGTEVWSLGRRMIELLWHEHRMQLCNLYRPMPEWAITGYHFGLDHRTPLPEHIDYYTTQGKTGNIAFITGVRAAESMVRYRSVVQKLHESYIVTPYKSKKGLPMKFAKIIYDWQVDDVFKFLSEEHGAEYCEYYDLATLTNSNKRVGIPLHAVAIRRIGDVVATEPEFYDGLWQCWPEIDAQRRWYPDFDIEKLIQETADGGWPEIREFIETYIWGEDFKRRAMSYAAEFRKKHASDPYSYPMNWLVRNLLLNSLTVSSVSPVGPKTKAHSVRQAALQQEEDEMI
jgi:predicted phosphoadenosine phosphosulfate sulfurtransferase